MALSEERRETLEKQVQLGADAEGFLSAGARSCRACGQGSSVFNERKNQIIREAIDWFRSPTASTDSHVAVRYVAALAEIVALQDALEYRVRKAGDARAALYDDQTAEA